MHIRTMALQINEKTWPVAVACLGSNFATMPFPDVEGSFLIINTPDRQRDPIGYRRTYGSSPAASISLGNIWMSEEDFRTMYKFDGRKNTEMFFDVRKVARRPVRRVEDDFGTKLKELTEAYYGERQPEHPDED